jgi:hypothetical protein
MAVHGNGVATAIALLSDQRLRSDLRPPPARASRKSRGRLDHHDKHGDHDHQQDGRFCVNDDVVSFHDPNVSESSEKGRGARHGGKFLRARLDEEAKSSEWQRHIEVSCQYSLF